MSMILSVDCDAPNVDDIKDILKYLMKKKTEWKCLDLLKNRFL